MGCRSEQMDATKPVNYADQMKVKISAKFMQIQLTGVIPHYLILQCMLNVSDVRNLVPWTIQHQQSGIAAWYEL